MAVSEAFLSTSAQVLPGMAITLIVEQSLFVRPKRKPRTAEEHRAYRRTLMAISAGLTVTVIGEAAALLGLLWKPSSLNAALVIVAMATLAVLLVAPFVGLIAREYRSPAPPQLTRGRVRRAIAIYSCVGVTGIAALVLLLQIVLLG